MMKYTKQEKKLFSRYFTLILHLIGPERFQTFTYDITKKFDQLAKTYPGITTQQKLEILFDKLVEIQSPKLICKGFSPESARALIKLFDGKLPL